MSRSTTSAPFDGAPRDDASGSSMDEADIIDGLAEFCLAARAELP
jgi:hypothetical protein